MATYAQPCAGFESRQTGAVKRPSKISSVSAHSTILAAFMNQSKVSDLWRALQPPTAHSSIIKAIFTGSWWVWLGFLNLEGTKLFFEKCWMMTEWLARALPAGACLAV